MLIPVTPGPSSACNGLKAIVILVFVIVFVVVVSVIVAVECYVTCSLVPLPSLLCTSIHQKVAKSQGAAFHVRLKIFCQAGSQDLNFFIYL